MEYYPIAVIGAGNLAWNLVPTLENAGHNITEVYSRNLTHASALAGCLYDTLATDNLNFAQSKALVFVLCVPDDAIADVAKQIVLPMGALLVHTSGSRSISALEYAEAVLGVFYPLQSFSKAKKADFSNIPICLECADYAGFQILENIARSIGNKIYTINSSDRAILHLAAVVANNFANHLFTIAADILNAEDLPAELLHPLMIETAKKAVELGPANAQTGPAIRHDKKTMQAHLQYLEPNPELHHLYTILSQSIQRNS